MGVKLVTRKVQVHLVSRFVTEQCRSFGTLIFLFQNKTKLAILKSIAMGFPVQFVEEPPGHMFLIESMNILFKPDE